MTEQTPFRNASGDDLKSGRAPKGRPKIWPFSEMEINQTISVEDKDRFHSARSSATRVTRLTGKKFKTVTLNNGSLLIRRIS